MHYLISWTDVYNEWNTSMSLYPTYKQTTMCLPYYCDIYPVITITIKHFKNSRNANATSISMEANLYLYYCLRLFLSWTLLWYVVPGKIYIRRDSIILGFRKRRNDNNQYIINNDLRRCDSLCIIFVTHCQSRTSMNYYPLFRVRSWNSGMRCMSLYILTNSLLNDHCL